MSAVAVEEAKVEAGLDFVPNARLVHKYMGLRRGTPLMEVRPVEGDSGEDHTDLIEYVSKGGKTVMMTATQAKGMISPYTGTDD